MATTTQPATGETTKQLINYRTDAGVAVIEMNDPPANTYTYEMNRQFDEAIRYQKNALADPAFEARFVPAARQRLELYQHKKPWREQ